PRRELTGLVVEAQLVLDRGGCGTQPALQRQQLCALACEIEGHLDDQGYRDAALRQPPSLRISGAPGEGGPAIWVSSPSDACAGSGSGFASASASSTSASAERRSEVMRLDSPVSRSVSARASRVTTRASECASPMMVSASRRARSRCS